MRVLWVDDEMEHLEAHVLYLRGKGIEVDLVSNANEALDCLHETPYDLLLLDEQMPGKRGLDLLTELKLHYPNLPVVMVTKSEEENLMNEAIGLNITDYLIKPVKPQQLLSSIKKILERKKLVSSKLAEEYQQEFRQIALKLMQVNEVEEWFWIYKKLVYWDLALSQSEEKALQDVLQSQRQEANNLFARYIEQNYLDWLHSEDRPLLAPDVFKKRFFPALEKGKKQSHFLILVDCLRYDQWEIFASVLQEWFYFETELFLSILPTATQYVRNSMFAGLFPLEIKKRFPSYWKTDYEEGLKNEYEPELLREQLVREKVYHKFNYVKIISLDEGRDLVNQVSNLVQTPLNFIVFNFIDTLSHARSEHYIMRELAPNEHALLSVTRAWLTNSYLLEFLKQLRRYNVRIFLTTDHGSIQVRRPIRIIGDRETTTNLRYKQGRNLNYDKKDRARLIEFTKPEDALLTKDSVSASYVFAKQDYFFVYPNNYAHYLNKFKDTFQHGGVSLEEMIIPWVELIPR